MTDPESLRLIGKYARQSGLLIGMLGEILRFCEARGMHLDRRPTNDNAAEQDFACMLQAARKLLDDITQEDGNDRQADPS